MLKKLLSLVLVLGLLLAVVPGSASAASGFRYIAGKGDTYASLSALYGVSINRLLTANGIQRNGEPLTSKRFWLSPGQEVIIPIELGTIPSRVNPFNYTVKPGDTLGLLTVRFEISAAAVAKVNNLDAGALTKPLSSGQTLLIPAGPHIWKLEPNESLGEVAALYGVSETYLLKANKAQQESELVGKTVVIPVQYDRPFTPMIGDGSWGLGGSSQPTTVATSQPPSPSPYPLTMRWVGQGSEWKGNPPTATFFVEFKGGKAPYRLWTPQWGAVKHEGPYTYTDANGETWTRLDFTVTAKCGETFRIEPNVTDAAGANVWTLRAFKAECK